VKARSAASSWIVGLALPFASLFFMVPNFASAQACCVGGGGQLGVVGRERRAALTAQLLYQRATGSYGDDGRYHPLRRISIDDVVLELGGGVRVFDHRLELSGSVPTRLQHRAFPGNEASTRVGLGDASVGLGVMVVRGSVEGMRRTEPSSYRPFLDLDLGVVLPTGRAPENASDQNGADVMGTGHFTLQGGFRSSQFLTLQHIVTLRVLYEQGLARDVPGPFGITRSYRPGRAVSVRASWLHVRDMRWSAGVFTNARFAASARQDGVRVPASASRRFSLGALLSWVFLLPNWEATLSLTLDTFFDGPDRNLPQVGPSLSVMVKRSF